MAGAGHHQFAVQSNAVEELRRAAVLFQVMADFLPDKSAGFEVAANYCRAQARFLATGSVWEKAPWEMAEAEAE